MFRVFFLGKPGLKIQYRRRTLLNTPLVDSALWITVALAILIAPLASSKLRRISNAGDLAGVKLILLAGWLRLTIPAAVLVLEGRAPDGRLAETNALSNAAELVTTTLLLVVSAVIIAAKIRHQTGSAAGLIAFLAPAGAGLVSGALNGQTLGYSAAGYVLAGVAMWVSRPPFRALGTLAALAGITAVASAVLALVKPELGLYPYSVYGQKSYLGGTALVGPFEHPNVLALILVFALPFARYLKFRVSRGVVTAAIVMCTLWTGSRSALLAMPAIVTVSVLHRTPMMTRLATALLGLFAILLPFLADDPSSFTGRGRIWIQGIHDWTTSPWFGFGPRYFTEQARLDSPLLGLTHGHNILVHAMLTGGLLAILCWALFFGMTALKAFETLAFGDTAPTAFLAALLTFGTLEASFLTVEAAGLLFWLPSAVLMLGRPDERFRPRSAGGHTNKEHAQRAESATLSAAAAEADEAIYG